MQKRSHWQRFDRTGNDRIYMTGLRGGDGGFDEIETALPCVGVHLSGIDRCCIKRTNVRDRRSIGPSKTFERQLTK